MTDVCGDQIFIKARPKRTSYQKASFEERAIYGLDYFFATEPGGKVPSLLFHSTTLILATPPTISYIVKLDDSISSGGLWQAIILMTICASMTGIGGNSLL